MTYAVIDRGEAKTRRKLDIEAALRWAHVEELPKAEAVKSAIKRGPAKEGLGWEKVDNYVTWLTEVDFNHFGVLPDPLRMGAPHEDALTIARAVAEFSVGHAIAMPEDWNPIADLGDLGCDGPACIRDGLDLVTRVGAGGERFCKSRPDHLLIKHAVLGGCPDWQIDKPERKVVSENGKPKWFRQSLLWIGDDLTGGWQEIETEGRNHKSKRPYDDAYRKTYLDPDPVLGIASRVEYEIWHGMMAVLLEMLAGELSSIELTPFRRSARPWETPDAAGGRMLRVEGHAAPEPGGSRGRFNIKAARNDLENKSQVRG